MKILLVEDDEKIGQFVSQGLKASGFIVDWVRQGGVGLDLALGETHALIILDLMLPEVDGWTILKKVKEARPEQPVLILSARGSVEDRVRGLTAGSDDYLAKPFAFSELLARVQALLRRSGMYQTETQNIKLTYDGLVMDLLKRSVTRDSQVIDLQPKEFSLLEYFMRNPERVLSKALILENIYQFDFDPATNVVDVLVFRLRSKIDRDFEKKLIHTIRGMGYVLKSEA